MKVYLACMCKCDSVYSLAFPKQQQIKQCIKVHHKRNVYCYNLKDLGGNVLLDLKQQSKYDGHRCYLFIFLH